MLLKKNKRTTSKSKTSEPTEQDFYAGLSKSIKEKKKEKKKDTTEIKEEPKKTSETKKIVYKIAKKKPPKPEPKWFKPIILVFGLSMLLLAFKGILTLEKDRLVVSGGVQNAYAKAILTEEDYDITTERSKAKPKQMSKLEKAQQELLDLKKTTDDAIFRKDLTIARLEISKEIGIIHNKTVDAIVEDVSYKEKMDKYLMHSIIWQESKYKKDAVSPVGACGYMQLMPNTAKMYGLTGKAIFDARRNIETGIKHFKSMLITFDGDVSLALAAYNAGATNVMKYGGIPPFKETQKYVTAILKKHKELISK